MSVHDRALIAWLNASPDPFRNAAFDASAVIASLNKLLPICPDRETKALAAKALKAAWSAGHPNIVGGTRAGLAYQLVRISVSKVVR